MKFVYEIVDFFSRNEPEQFEDAQVRVEFHKRFGPELSRYIKYYDSFKESVEGKYSEELKRLVILRVFAMEVWDQVFENYDEVRHDHLKYRVSAIGKILNRVLLSIDENIVLLRNGVGFSVLVNCRMILESYAFANYIYSAGEVEADRFQDFAKVQKSKIVKDSKMYDGIAKKYNNDFLKNNGWISDASRRSLTELIKDLKEPLYNSYYKYLCDFVHASPYSIDVATRLASSTRIKEEHHLPLGFTDTVNLNVRLLYDLVFRIIDYFLDEDKELFHIALNAITKWA